MPVDGRPFPVQQRRGVRAVRTATPDAGGGTRFGGVSDGAADRMKILVYGAGVLGSLYGARLHDAGHQVSILARGRRSADLREHGVVLQEGDRGPRTVTPVEVVERLDPDAGHDLVVVLVRAHQLTPVLEVLASSPATADVLFMLNHAAGPAPLTQAVGRERVVLGFPGAGGLLEGHVVRYLRPGLVGRLQPTTFGELDRATSPRLDRLAATFGSAGFPVATNPRMDAWLKTHAAVVVAAAAAVHAAEGDVHRLARSPAGLRLLVRAAREHLTVLRALGVPPTPAGQSLVLQRVPERLLVAALSRLLDTRAAELALDTRTDAARHEAIELAGQLAGLARLAGRATPAADRLRRHLDPATPPPPPDATR